MDRVSGKTVQRVGLVLATVTASPVAGDNRLMSTVRGMSRTPSLRSRGARRIGPRT